MDEASAQRTTGTEIAIRLFASGSTSEWTRAGGTTDSVAVQWEFSYDSTPA